MVNGMTFQDIFKSDFLENINSIPMFDMVLALALAFLLGLFIFFIYKSSYSGVMYSDSFGVTLVALSLITTLLILTVVSNEPMDIAFLFWSIAVGIVLAAGLIPLAVFGSIFIGVVLYVFSKKKTVDSPYILIVYCADGDTEKQVRSFTGSQVRRMNLKSKSLENGCVELNYEVRLKNDDSSFVNELDAMQGVSRVALVSYNGDYMG